MAIPDSGQLGVSQHLNRELGRSINAEFSIDTAENGGYGAINQASRSRPSATNPAYFSEWYGYDHNASSGPTTVALPETGYAGSTSTAARALDDACRNSVSRPGRYWGQTDNLVESVGQNRFFSNSTGTNLPPAGYYAQFGTEAVYWNGTTGTRIEVCRI